MITPESDKNSKSTKREKQADELRRLCRKTQALPQARQITDEIIVEEIEKTRNQ